MLKKGLFLFLFVILVIVYFAISKMFSKNNQFIQYHLVLNSTLEEARNNKNLIRKLDSTDYGIIGDEDFVRFVVDSLDIWKEYIVYVKQYGILPIKSKPITDDLNIGVNLSLKKNIDWFSSRRLRQIEIKSSKGSHDLVNMQILATSKVQTLTIQFLNTEENIIIGKLVVK